MSRSKVEFLEALKALLEGRCDSVEAEGDSGHIILMKTKPGAGHREPMLCFEGTGQAIPAEYMLREFTLNGEKVEMVNKDIINVYVTNSEGVIISGPYAHGTVLPLAPGHSTVNVAGTKLVPATKKMVKHVIKDVSWHKTKNLEQIEHLGKNDYAHPFFPFYPCGPVRNLLTPLITTLGDKRCTLTIEYEE